MGDKQEENVRLFLFEVLVDYLTISNSRLNLDKNVLSNLTDTCVLFQFLNYPPLVVCESDFIGTSQNHIDTSQVNFKSGKSCFFSLRAPTGPILPVPFDVKVSVIRKLREVVLPNKLDIGKTMISMGVEFTELLRQSTDKEYDAMPLSRNKNGIFEITDASGKSVGSLAAFIRLSCFGKLIVTQFSLNKENYKSYLFKGADMSKTCQQLANENMKRDTNELYESGVLLPSLINKLGSQDSYKAHMKRPAKSRVFDVYSTDRKLKDITAFPKSLRCKEEYHYEKDHSECMEFINLTLFDCQNFKSNFLSPCKQNMSNIARGNRDLGNFANSYDVSDKSNYSKRADKKKCLAPGDIGMQGDQDIFQLPLKRAGDALSAQDKIIGSTVYYKLKSEPDSTPEYANVNECETKLDDTSKQAIDNSSSMFLLRIGNKINSNKKRNLELELKSRNTKDANRPLKDHGCQYKVDDYFSSKETRVQENTKMGKDR